MIINTRYREDFDSKIKEAKLLGLDTIEISVETAEQQLFSNRRIASILADVSASSWNPNGSTKIVVIKALRSLTSLGLRKSKELIDEEFEKRGYQYQP